MLLQHARGDLAALNQRGLGNRWDPISWRPVLFTGSIIDAGRAPPTIGLAVRVPLSMHQRRVDITAK